MNMFNTEYEMSLEQFFRSMNLTFCQWSIIKNVFPMLQIAFIVNFFKRIFLIAGGMGGTQTHGRFIKCNAS